MGVRETIVAYARCAIGCEYDYTPSGGVEGESYNCSFLSFCAYRHAGLEIPTWQGHQNGEGSQSDWVRWNDHWTTDPDELQPGDLVFFGDSPYNTGHVGISLGSTAMIDSVPNGGVQERELYGNFVGGGWPLPDLPDDSSPILLPAQGAVRFRYGMNIRRTPDPNGEWAGWIDAGATRNIDGTTLANDMAWCHYIGSSSGKDCFVAIAGNGYQFAEVIA